MMITAENRSLRYDAESRVKSSREPRALLMSYDAEGRRVKKINEDLSETLVMVYDSDGKMVDENFKKASRGWEILPIGTIVYVTSAKGADLQGHRLILQAGGDVFNLGLRQPKYADIFSNNYGGQAVLAFLKITVPSGILGGLGLYYIVPKLEAM
jgi:hypothetical protein